MAYSTDARDRNRHDELSTPLADMRHLSHDLVFEIPRQDQDVVVPGLVDPIGSKNRNVRPGCELSVFVRIAVDGVLEKIGANAAIVQERIALARCAIPGHRSPGTLRVDEKREQPSFRVLHLLPE